jgi:hypothetical protein
MYNVVKMRSRTNCTIETIQDGWAWWYIPAISALGMLRQNDHDFAFANITVKPLCTNFYAKNFLKDKSKQINQEKREKRKE